jgi:leucyl-tRNA synthetase
MYTRFICMALTQAGALRMGDRPLMKDPAEPFRKFRAHGLLIREGSKMSKSKGNVVNPDEYAQQYGADTVRMYLMFLGPYTQGGDFRDKDIAGVRRFLERVWRWYVGDSGEGADIDAVLQDFQTIEEAQKAAPKSSAFPGAASAAAPPKSGDSTGQMPKSAVVKLHQTIKKIGEDLDNLSYNTAIAALMELHNALKAAGTVTPFAREAFVLLLAPFAPHIAEEIWSTVLGKAPSIFNARWPAFDPALTVEDTVELAVQVNGKLRDRFTVARDADEASVRAEALALPKVQELLAGKEPKKVIVVKGRLVNVIV